MVELNHRAKFRQNRSKRSRDMAIFRFLQDGGRPPSWICNACVGTTRKGHLVVVVVVFIYGGLYHCAKCGWNRCSSFDNMHVFRFRGFSLKTPIHPKFFFVFIS